MRRVNILIWSLAGVGLLLPPLLAACGDPAKGPFDEAATLDRELKQFEAATSYMKVYSGSPDSRFGKLAKARAEVLLLELGAQHLQQKNWPELEKAAGQLLELDGDSIAGNLYRAYALYGQEKHSEAAEQLKKAEGEPQGVAPPSKTAIEATAQALFDGAEAGAKAALEGSVVDESFLKNARARLNNKIVRQSVSIKRRAELAKEGTLEAMATLLDNYPDSSEAAKVRGPYAEKIAAKLRSVESVGPPRVEDPDPIATLADALSTRAPDEDVSKQALERIKGLHEAWEEQYEEELKTIDEQVTAYHAKAMDSIATIIREKCAPLRAKSKTDSSVLEELNKAREEAAKLVPNGLTPEDLQEVSLYIVANCTPHKQEEE